MAGRLFQGQWNLAFFDTATGKNLHAKDAKHRITDTVFGGDGSRLFLAKSKQQEKKKDGQWADYGAIEILSVDV
jgi:hypothetical protein